MSAGALLLLPLLLLIQLGCVTLLSVPQGGRVDGTQRGVAQTLRLGLRDVLPASSVTPHRKAPQFMLDLFNVVSLGEGTQQSLKDILEGNIVRSFEDKGPVGEKIHFFNVSSLARGEKIVKAELRWFRKKHMRFLRKSRDPHFYQVDLYEVLDSRVTPLRRHFITSRLVPLHTPGWEVFNITQMDYCCLQFQKIQKNKATGRFVKFKDSVEVVNLNEENSELNLTGMDRTETLTEDLKVKH